MKCTINKDNWSGEDGTYEVLKNNVVKMDNGDKYTMQGYEDEFGNKRITVLSHQHNMEKIWMIYEDEGEYYASEYGYEREGKTPAEVVAKMHWGLC